jgi:hypothetical protein
MNALPVKDLFQGQVHKMDEKHMVSVENFMATLRQTYNVRINIL